jgi:hypothetical protein
MTVLVSSSYASQSLFILQSKRGGGNKPALIVSLIVGYFCLLSGVLPLVLFIA